MKKLRLLLPVLFMTAILSSCSSSNPPSASSSGKADDSISSSVSSNTGSSSSSSSTATAGAASSETPAETTDTRGILGSHGTDIRMGLSDFGLPEGDIKPAPAEATAVYAFSSSSTYQDAAGFSLDYSLTMDSDFQIIGASFNATNTDLSTDDFLSIATYYLGFSATMPYDAADAETAKAWVSDNISQAVNGNSPSTAIGDAKFELFASECGPGYGDIGLYISKEG